MLLVSSGAAVLDTGTGSSGASVGGRVDGRVDGAVTLVGGGIVSVVDTEGGTIS